MSGVKIGIRFDVADVRRWLRALSRVESEVNRWAREIPRLGSLEYKQLLVGNIMEQKHMSFYPPYNTRYAYWKSTYGTAQGYWKLFGDLVRAITSFRISDRYGRHAYFSGVPAGVTDIGGKSWFGMGKTGPPKEIAWYGRIMEKGGTFSTRFGTQHHPARPIFEPTMEEYAEGGWLVNGEKAMNQIGGHWR